MLLPNLIPSAFVNMAAKSVVIMALYAGLMFVFKLDLNKDIVYMFKKILKKA